MWMRILAAIFRSVCAYAAVIILCSIAGRRLSKNMFFDFTAGVALGVFTVKIALGNDTSLLMAVISTAIFACLIICTEKLSFKSPRLFRFLNGGLSQVVRNGEIMDGELKKTGISLIEFLSMLHEKGIFGIEDIEAAFIETGGKLSVMPKPEKRLVTLSDIGKSGMDAGVPVDIIMNGELLSGNLESSGHDEQWLISQLSPKKLKVENIFYACLRTNGELYISIKNGPD